ncbi:MAG: saccharopine dehydrogenase NADP-binding domain-containing protein [Planctomycetes bacterium]|nr:saccharopine dehydrogenase NADP-binding domain-containing protein [Planctomycetota bacterium]
MSHHFGVLGAGRQGVAAAYDMLACGGANSVTLLDVDLARAKKAAARVNTLTRSTRAHAGRADVKDPRGLARTLKGFDAVLNASPYRFNIAVTQAALKARVNLCDLGGNTGIVLRQLKFDREARRAGVTIVPDCGLAPGMGNVLARLAIERLQARGAKPEAVRIYCGGLPQHPRPPLNYQLLFAIEGLINEYLGHAHYLRRGRIAEVETLGEVEALEFPKPVGRCEAFVTSGGLSLLPWRLRGTLKTLEYKTVRYPGHVEKIRLLRELGVLDEKPVTVRGQEVVPQQIFAATATPRLTFKNSPDVVVLRVAASGRRGNGLQQKIRLDLLDRFDAKTGFTAMERTTGFSAAIIAEMLARGEARPGVWTQEDAVPPETFSRELARRGLRVAER